MTFPQGGSFIHPTSQAQKFIILLHGYGANGANLIDLGYLWKEKLPPTLFWSPDGLDACEESSFGFQWFSLRERTQPLLTMGVGKAAPIVANAIQDHLNILHLTPQDVMIVGFSQGAMLALDIMWHIQELGGVLAYSGQYLQQARHASPPKTPVLLVHGTDDTVIPFHAMQSSEQDLRTDGINVTTYTCQGTGHMIDEKGLQKGIDFLRSIINRFDV